MDPRGRLGRRTLLAGGAVMAALPAITACGPEKPQVPTITRQEVQDLQDNYAHKLFVALRTRDPHLLRTIETNPLLNRDLATIELADRLHAPRTAEEYTLPNSAGYPIRSGTGHDHQRLITVSNYSNTKRNWRDLALYVRNGPGQPWLRAYGAGLNASELPDFGRDQPLTPLAPDATGYPAEPNAIPGVVAKALADPASEEAKLFAPTDVLQRYATTLTSIRQQAVKIGTVARGYRPGAVVTAIAIGGGYLVLGSFSYEETLTAHPGRRVSFTPRSSQHRLYPGRYRTTTASYGAMFAASVPQHGKIRLISGEQRQTGLSAA